MLFIWCWPIIVVDHDRLHVKLSTSTSPFSMYGADGNIGDFPFVGNSLDKLKFP